MRSRDQVSIATATRNSLAAVLLLLPLAAAGIPVLFSTEPDPFFAPLGTGTVTLNDSATLSIAPTTPSGSITFKLIAPDGTTVLYTDTITGVTANDTPYSTATLGNLPGGFTLPTIGSVTGMYSWDATYSGTGGPLTDNTETVTATAAMPTITTTAGGDVIIGSGAKLTDSAALAGGYFPDGTITFTLDNPSNVAVYTDVVTVTGNGTYTTSGGTNPGGFLPTSPGTYQWHADYVSGPSLNNVDVSSLLGDEPQVVIGRTAPEPATLGLLGISLAGLGFARRRKKVNPFTPTPGTKDGS